MLEYRSTEVNHPEKKWGLDLPTILTKFVSNKKYSISYKIKCVLCVLWN